MKSIGRRTVRFLTAILPHYRAAFHERVRNTLAQADIDYHLIYGQPNGSEILKGDTVSLDWAREIHNVYLGGDTGAPVWQPAAADMLGADLAIIGQENRLLVNYPLIALRRLVPMRLAFWGHGHNYQAQSVTSISERWKRVWSMSCDWWFGYTEAVRAELLAAGYPGNRITVFNNSIDTAELMSFRDELGFQEVADLRAKLQLTPGWTAVFVGGLHYHKRIPFLVEAAERVARRHEAFRLVIAGGGVQADALHAMKADRPWLKVLKPTFARDKATLMMAADVYVMPGLVGLGVLDSSVFSLPVLTTAYPGHSPEFAYLQDGVSAMVVQEWRSAAAYAEALEALLKDEPRRRALSHGASRLASMYSIGEMARRFSQGVVAALDAPKLGN